MAMIEQSRAIRTIAPRFANIGLMKRLALWRSRRDLANLDARALKDIGIDPEAAKREARLTVWDVPVSWTNR